MRLKAYSDNYHCQWDDFVKSSRNGTIMQERRFLSYHYPGRFEDYSLMAYNSKSKLMAVIPAALKKIGDEKIFCSYPGASHGGIVVNKMFGTDEALTLVPLLIEKCKDYGFSSIEIKMVPRIYQNWPSDEISFALRYNGFSLMSTELATVLPLKEITLKPDYMEESVRRNIRKSEKLGVFVEESNDYATYWSILENNLMQRHNARPTHNLSEIKDLTSRYPQEIKLFGAFYEGRMIGGVVTFLMNSRVISCFYIAHNSNYQYLRSLNLLFFKLINWGIENGYQYLDWGISTENKGKCVNMGLFKFKEGFGGRGVIRETYSLSL